MPENMLTFCKYAGAFAILCGALSKSLLAKNREEELAAKTVHFDSRSPEFDRLVGRKPSYEYLATGRADLLGAHEGAVFLEHGSQDSSPILSRSPCLIFTTKPLTRIRRAPRSLRSSASSSMDHARVTCKRSLHQRTSSTARLLVTTAASTSAFKAGWKQPPRRASTGISNPLTL